MKIIKSIRSIRNFFTRIVKAFNEAAEQQREAELELREKNPDIYAMMKSQQMTNWL